MFLKLPDYFWEKFVLCLFGGKVVVDHHWLSYEHVTDGGNYKLAAPIG